MRQATRKDTGKRAAMVGRFGYSGTIENIDPKGFATVRRDDGSEFFCAVGVLVVSR